MLYFEDMKQLLLLIAICFCTGLQAQEIEQEEAVILKVVDNVFLGMLNADSAMVATSFSPDAGLETVVDDRGTLVVRKEKLSRFLEAVNAARKGFWIEKSISQEVRINGEMAHVWMEYEFWLGEQYLHCGVNSFQLAKLDGQWKIIYLCDNRRESCEFQKKASE